MEPTACACCATVLLPTYIYNKPPGHFLNKMSYLPKKPKSCHCSLNPSGLLALKRWTACFVMHTYLSVLVYSSTPSSITGPLPPRTSLPLYCLKCSLMQFQGHSVVPIASEMSTGLLLPRKTAAHIPPSKGQPPCCCLLLAPSVSNHAKLIFASCCCAFGRLLPQVHSLKDTSSSRMSRGLCSLLCHPPPLLFVSP